MSSGSGLASGSSVASNPAPEAGSWSNGTTGTSGSSRSRTKARTAGAVAESVSRHAGSQSARTPASLPSWPGQSGAEEGYGDDAGVQAAEERGRVVEPLGQHEGGPFAGGRDRDEVVGDGSGPGVEGAPAEGAVPSRGGAVGEVDVAEGALLRPVPGPVPQMVRHEGGFDSWPGGRSWRLQL